MFGYFLFDSLEVLYDETTNVYRRTNEWRDHYDVRQAEDPLY